MKNKKNIFIFIFLLTSSFIYISEAIANNIIGKFIYVKGNVNVLRKGEFPAVRVKINDPVFVNDIVRTKTNSLAKIEFIDKNIITIAQRSRIDVSEYILNKIGIINLPRGHLEAIVPSDSNRKIKFEVKTPNAVAGVRGTHFFVLNRDINTVIFVQDGQVYTKNPAFPDKIIILEPMTMTIVSPNKPPTEPIKAKPQDIEKITSEFKVTPKPINGEDKESTPSNKKDFKPTDTSDTGKQKSKIGFVQQEEKPQSTQGKIFDGSGNQNTDVLGPGELTPEDGILPKDLPSPGDANLEIKLKVTSTAIEVPLTEKETEVIEKPDIQQEPIKNIEDDQSDQGQQEIENPQDVQQDIETGEQGDTEEDNVSITNPEDNLEQDIENQQPEQQEIENPQDEQQDIENQPEQEQNETGQDNNSQQGYTPPPYIPPSTAVDYSMLKLESFSISKLSSGYVIDESISGSLRDLGVPITLKLNGVQVPDNGFNDLSPGTYTLEASASFNNIIYKDEIQFRLYKFISNTSDPYQLKIFLTDTEKGSGLVDLSFTTTNPPPDPIIAGGILINQEDPLDKGYWIVDDYDFWFISNRYFSINPFKFAQLPNNSTTLIEIQADILDSQALTLDFLTKFSGDNDSGLTLYKENLQNSGMLEGYLGATNHNSGLFLWDMPVDDYYPIHFLGEVSSNIAIPLAWYSSTTTPFTPFNYNDSTYTTYDGGKFNGFFQGTIVPIRDTSAITGYNIAANLYAIYIDPENNVGIMKGRLGYDNENNYFDQIKMFAASGGVTTTSLITNYSGDFYSDLSYQTMSSLDSFAMTIDTETFDSAYLTQHNLELLGIKSEPWIILRSIFAGTTTSPPSEYFKWSFESSFQDFYLIGSGQCVNQNEGPLMGDVLGYYSRIDSSNKPQTGVIVGESLGTFDPNSQAWQMITTMLAMDTPKLIELQNNNPDALRKLDIPCVEVAKVTLSGSGNNFSSLSMENVVFLAREGSNPQIWATENVHGDYTSPPVINQAITLSDGVSLSADFTFKEWDTSTSNWKASVSGSGSIGTTPSYDVQFQGIAAGIGASTDSGTIMGTAAGIVQIQ